MSAPLVLPTPIEIIRNNEEGELSNKEDKDMRKELHACPLCNAVFANASFLSKHMKRKCIREENINNPHKCEHCPLSFKQSRQLKGHLLLHSGVRPFKCDQCEKAFLTKAHLKRHSVIHLPEEEIPFKCELCGKGFAWASLLEAHKKSHYGEKQYKCGICARMFQHMSTFKVHTRNRHMVDGFFHCAVCKEKFNDISKLLTHMKTHEKEKSVKCERCSACFLTLQDLETHVCVNFGGQPLLCQFCSIEFPDTESFCDHSCMHVTANRICSCCKKEFKNIWHMKEHLITHCAEKPYLCKHCDTSFRRKRELEIHLTKHISGTKRFHCELCSNSFTSESYLKSHMRVEHREKTHLCEICGHYFMYKSLLKTHMEFHKRTGNTKFGKKNHRRNEHVFVPGLAEKMKLVAQDSTKSKTDNADKNSDTSLALSPVIASDSLNCNTDSSVESHKAGFIIQTSQSENSNILLSNQNTVEDLNNLNREIDEVQHTLLDHETETLNINDPLLSSLQEQVTIEKDFVTGKSIFRCSLCLDVFDSYSLFLRHQKEFHSVGKEYHCEICGRYFSLAANLSQHMNMHRNSKSNYKYSCQYCGNHFKVIYKLREHLRSKHNEINNQTTDLELHMQHNKDRDLYKVNQVDNAMQTDLSIDTNLSPLSFLCIQNDGDALLLNEPTWAGKLTHIQNLGVFQTGDTLAVHNEVELTATHALGDILPSNSDFDVNSINNSNISYMDEHVVTNNNDSLLQC